MPFSGELEANVGSLVLTLSELVVGGLDSRPMKAALLERSRAVVAKTGVLMDVKIVGVWEDFKAVDSVGDV